LFSFSTFSHLVGLLAAADPESGPDMMSNMKSVIFVCVFLILVIVVAIWWLRR
jgi:uncharacterized membrane protein AbrB (regulator of aidB expression)